MKWKKRHDDIPTQKIIIPKGTIIPGTVTVIEVPQRYSKQPVVVMQRDGTVRTSAEDDPLNYPHIVNVLGPPVRASCSRPQLHCNVLPGYSQGPPCNPSYTQQNRKVLPCPKKYMNDNKSIEDKNSSSSCVHNSNGQQPCHSKTISSNAAVPYPRNYKNDNKSIQDKNSSSSGIIPTSNGQQPCNSKAIPSNAAFIVPYNCQRDVAAASNSGQDAYCTTFYNGRPLDIEEREQLEREIVQRSLSEFQESRRTFVMASQALATSPNIRIINMTPSERAKRGILF